ncbi:MAG: hypothetical protein CXT66_00970 [Methanobacteriota archaeon]|nr:MAG: hypothetical protein CXT66_00970 [Euryarchaeota archaeon]
MELEHKELIGMEMLQFNIDKIMDKRIVSMDMEANVTETMDAMHEAGVWSIIVTKEGRPEGVVTERDLLRRCFRPGLDPDLVKVGQIMSYPLVTIEMGQTIGSVLGLLMVDGIRRAYVEDSEGEIIGRVTQTQCLKGTLEIIMALR